MIFIYFQAAIILIKVQLSSVPKTAWGARLQSPPDHINKQAMINLEIIFVYVVRSIKTVIGYYTIVRSFPAGSPRMFLKQNSPVSRQYYSGGKQTAINRINRRYSQRIIILFKNNGSKI